ncbi:MAG: 30S ribosomal protein S18 [Candidatus Portnoybacteria bacterium CG_4_8_14_3_um_filter_44_15]|uniref:Small ribosomal subunit protein bS18 n=1 Tax=Candidatus Portnoybacteria bacterium CG_4_8_14_3_um_filter_44_15 TaxID=1974803 RepID=A0A2M7IDS0_9BACT|nr:MAG: 30S ribosomal protein S18 [Candidatus Portnoybacteria bacterium CG_4_8_14_3_um_filter_44_15]
MIKNCHFCQQKIEEIDEQDTELLRKFLSGQAKILSPRRTGICAKHQRKVAKAIKKARLMGLLPFIVK